MIVFKTAHDLSNHLQKAASNGKAIGFVPTMGAIHQGHLSLINVSKKRDDLTVCSVFVNPTQFNNPSDLKRYPKTLEKDINALITTSCDVAFIPSIDEIYPPGYTAPAYDLGDLDTVLEGWYRPGHFQGVCQVVDRLLQIVAPDHLYLGQKDYQQCKVIQQLIGQIKRSKEIATIIHPTLREADGLAMSSRNLRLNKHQRKRAPVVYTNLVQAKKEFGQQPNRQITANAVKQLQSEGFRVDYFQIVDANTLLPVNDTRSKQIAVTAVWLDDIRLIDNLPLN